MKTKTLADCAHGTFTVFADDEFVGKSLEVYGDYSEDEVSMFRACLGPDDIAIEVGSNIGALTVPLSRLCKKVYAFEPQPEIYDVLVRNLYDNAVENVVPVRMAVGSHSDGCAIPSLAGLKHQNFGRVEIEELGGGLPSRGCEMNFVQMTTLDQFIPTREQKIKFIKLDCEGSEVEVLKGAERLIARDRPYLYVECDRYEKAPELLGWLLDHGYRCFWHRPPLYYKDNPRGHKHNVWNGYIVSVMLICVPEELKMRIKGLDEAGDARIDPQMYDRELARWQRLWDTNPDDPELGFRVAHYHNLQNNSLMARKTVAKTLAIDPKHEGILHLRGMLDLQDGNFAEGWQAYELRYTMKDREGFGYRDHDAPHWDGRYTSAPVLIWAEQGFGDTIMFCRFMDEVLKRAPNAFLEVPAALYELLEISGIVPEGRLYRIGRTLPSYAYHCSLPSIPATLGFIDEKQVVRRPYLFADPSMVASWRKSDKPKIGLCCRGGVASERAYSRDIPKELMLPLAKEFGPFVSLEHDGQWESYADTASCVSALDLVMTVDTSMAHLAGALGVPTYLMLSSDPDWRWQRVRSDSPWYPSMTIFRQKQFMDWTPVVESIRGVLSEAREMAAE